MEVRKALFDTYFDKMPFTYLISFKYYFLRVVHTQDAHFIEARKRYKDGIYTEETLLWYVKVGRWSFVRNG